MSQMTKMTLRLSQVQRTQLKVLSDKLQIDESNVMRLALTRMAEEEGIIVNRKSQA